MSTTISFNNSTYTIPAVGERQWGNNVSNYLIAIAAGALTKAGGNFTLTADTNFGATYGLVTKYLKSYSSNIATAGVIRFANNEGLGFRNAANSADLIVKINASNRLEVDGTNVVLATDKLSTLAATTSSELAGIISDETGSGSLVFANSPTLVTPTLGVASATSINKVAITAPATGSTITVADGKTLTASNTLTLSATDGSSAAFGTGGTVAFKEGTLAQFAATTSLELKNLLSDETGSGAAVFGTSPTIATPVIDDGLYLNHESSVTTPAAGKIALYPKSDNKLYVKDSGGAEVQVGSGAGSGVINYILNPDAESATTGWATYADAAASTPVDGAGGSPNSTFTRNTTNPLRGNADFKFSKGAANRQGEGFSYDFSISVVDKSKKLSISVDLNTNTTNYSAGDLVCYVYDVTNAVLITPSSTSVPKISGTHYITFDSTTSTSYRLIFHVATTNATAYDLYFDNFVVGPSQIVQGAVISDWQTFSPTVSFTNSTSTGRYRRVGSDMEILVETGLSGTPAAGDYTFTLPFNFTISTAALTINSLNSNHFFIGTGAIRRSGVNTYLMRPRYASSTTIRLDTFITDAANATPGTLGASYPYSPGSGDYLTWRAIIPIAEWAGSGTVNIGAGAQVEYAYNTSTSTSASDSTSFAYGPQGAQIQNITAVISRRVQFQSPIQPDDVVILEVSDNRQTWLPIGSACFVNNGGVIPLITENTTSYGMGIDYISNTQLDVVFGQYPTMYGKTTVGGAGQAWSVAAGAGYWRVRKVKASSPVGFGMASSLESGLVKPRKGQTSLSVSGTQSWVTGRAVGIYYQDQDGNHRLKFNITGTCSNVSKTGITLTISGIVAKNVSDNYQPVACTAFTASASVVSIAYANPNNGVIAIEHNASSSATNRYGVSGDIELESKPSWA